MNTVSKVSAVKSPIIPTKEKKSAKAAATATATTSPKLNKVINGTAAVMGGAVTAGVVGTLAHAAIRDTAFFAGAGLVIGGLVGGMATGNFVHDVLNHAPGQKYKFLGTEIDLDTVYDKASTFLSDPKNAMLTTAGAIGVTALAATIAPWTTAIAGVGFVVGYAGTSLDDKQPAPTP